MEKSLISRHVWTNPIYFVAFGFGAGLSPLLPGTMGTLIAIPFYLLMRQLSWQLYLIIVVVSFVVGVWFCDQTEKMVQQSDYSGIVWDEIVGYWATMFLAPSGWQWIFLGFVLFRLFDIIKPWPISWVNDHVHRGFGIMFDDLLAGLLALAVIQLAKFFIYS